MTRRWPWIHAHKRFPLWMPRPHSWRRSRGLSCHAHFPFPRLISAFFCFCFFIRLPRLLILLCCAVQWQSSHLPILLTRVQVPSCQWMVTSVIPYAWRIDWKHSKKHLELLSLSIFISVTNVTLSFFSSYFSPSSVFFVFFRVCFLFLLLCSSFSLPPSLQNSPPSPNSVPESMNWLILIGTKHRRFLYVCGGLCLVGLYVLVLKS